MSDPMRLLVLGDFSGSPAAERPALASRPARRVDIDNIDEVMRRLEPRATVASGEIAFRHIDDFHPDRLYARLEQFAALRNARMTPPAARDDQVARLLGAPPAPSETAAATRSSGLDALIRDAIAPHIVKDTAAQQASHEAATDAAIAHEMRRLLHDPAFQQLESCWRGVRWLVAGLELDESLQLHLFDVSRDEMLADIVVAQGKLARTGLHAALVDRVPDSDRWSALVTLFQFGSSNADVALLAALGTIASHAGGPVLAGADPALAAEDARAVSAWQELRRSDAARWIGLAAPRLLLRLPYGRRSDPIDAFGFEEIAGAPATDELLWGNAALAMAMLIGRSFSARGWEMEPGDERVVGDLPAYTFERDGEREMQPCTERLLTERDIDAYLKSGVVPIAGRRDRNEAVAVRFQSVAEPSAPLAW